MFASERLIYQLSSRIISRHLLPVLNVLDSACSVSMKYSPSVFVKYSHDLAIQQVSALDRSDLPVNKYCLRSHTCGELTSKNVGTTVQLNGWIEYQRMNKFITLRDAYGSTQLIISDDRTDLIEIIKNLPYESVIRVVGIVNMRPEEQVNKTMKTGDIEIQVDSIKVLNKALAHLPFSIRHYNKAKEITQMKYRYLALRYPEMQKNLRTRSKLIAKMREYLITECDFVDVETPTLFRSTPGGAQEFVVPTRHPGKFYSLVQSPQQFKQLLMVGGIDRYFQIARCYRDEGARHDRQPEFTQLDIEMSFADQKGIMELIENLLKYSWPETITTPFKRLTYDDAMRLYGTDQPDLRILYEIQYLKQIINMTVLEENIKLTNSKDCEVCALVFPNKHEYLTRSVKEEFNDIKNKYFSATRLFQIKISDNSWKLQLDKLFSSNITENIIQMLNLNIGDILFLTIGPKLDSQKLLGKLRIEFTNILENNHLKIRSSGYNFLWLIDFPLFEVNESQLLKSMHHPFTQPHPEDMKYLITNPEKVRGLHYDLILNGSEIGGGSVRIHDANLQKQILKMLDINEEQLSHMLEALSSGAPPHSGIALGLDRLVCLLCNTESIRNVIAFPKTIEGRDLMSGAPIPISTEAKELYHIKTVDEQSNV
ncbi:aspartate--tRNA ligase, mitochondrial-like isoform X1 [Vespa mandarinia]|uniref:aspartate--tRNA ligase, mitochondrial-like isoform X1 n=2 Tax=Vespa mandarinia TaxID=7446 RepID=UPI00161CE387|nr:aspartate--tRNA ligase, mitochondrial-like isoform X1 [Vespa mandarinia]XP_035731568.1 aspartate--tRNA ligase, mitochondrial-like isoform X1 [Vespa mandarinia]XP_035731569.1 aspartate--tRNA ligase, mitochondrial-like isoform X1 [Vespa mandarinia]